MNTAAEIFAIINACIEAIGDEMDRLFESLKTAPREDFPRIEREIACLADEHENLIPHWKSLRLLLANQKKAE